MSKVNKVKAAVVFYGTATTDLCAVMTPSYLPGSRIYREEKGLGKERSNVGFWPSVLLKPVQQPSQFSSSTFSHCKHFPTQGS